MSTTPKGPKDEGNAPAPGGSNAPRPYGLKQKILRDKKHRSQVKKMRRPE